MARHEVQDLPHMGVSSRVGIRHLTAAASPR